MRRFIYAAVTAATLFAATATSAGPNDPDDPCFISSGCFWDATAGVWRCADPGVYANCVS